MSQQATAQSTTQLATVIADQMTAAPIPSTGEMLFVDGMMERLERFAELMSTGRSTIPAHLRGSKGDCMAVVMQAAQWKMNPFAVAQKTHLVYGTLGYEAQLVNAVITSMAPTKDRIHYEWFGPWEKVIGKFKTMEGQNGKYQVPDWKPADEEGCGVRVWATLKGENEPRELALLLSQSTVRNSTLWAGDPKQQLAYLAVKRWSRLYTPDVIMGVYTPDELQELPREEKDITPQQEEAATEDVNTSITINALKRKIAAVKDLAGLESIGKDIKGKSEDIQNALREAYKKRFTDLGGGQKKAKAEPKQEPKKTGPTYAVLMEHLNMAEAVSEVENVLNNIDHLPDDQQAEIQKAADAKLMELTSDE